MNIEAFLQLFFNALTECKRLRSNIAHLQNDMNGRFNSLLLCLNTWIILALGLETDLRLGRLDTTPTRKYVVEHGAFFAHHRNGSGHIVLAQCCGDLSHTFPIAFVLAHTAAPPSPLVISAGTLPPPNIHSFRKFITSSRRTGSSEIIPISFAVRIAPWQILSAVSRSYRPASARSRV